MITVARAVAERSDDDTPSTRTRGSTAEKAVAMSRAAVFVTALLVNQSDLLSGGHGFTPLTFLSAVAIVYVIITGAFSLLDRDDRRAHLPLLVVDILLVTGIIYTSGGIRNEYYLMYYVPIMQAAVRLNLRDAVATAVLSAALYTMLGLTSGRSATVPVSVHIRTFTFALSALFLAVSFGLLGRELRRHIRRADTLTQLTKAMSMKAALPELSEAAETADGEPDLLGATGPLAQSLQLAEEAPIDVLRLLGSALGADYGLMRLNRDLDAEVTWTSPNVASEGPKWGAMELAHKLVALCSACADAVVVPNVMEEPELRELAPTECEPTGLAVPLAVGSRPLGTVALYGKRPTVTSPGHRFDGNDLRMASALASQAAVLLDYARLHRSLYDVLRRAVGTLAAAVDAKDPLTRGHSGRVAHYAAFLTRALGLPPKSIEAAQLGALLHDVGKIGMDEQLLKGDQCLDEAGWRMVREHPATGAGIFAHMAELWFLLPALRHHHERWDGRGYPDGLQSEDIPLLARIVAVADAFDAMTSERVYRGGAPLTFHQACQELLDGAGTQFDPNLARLFVLHATPDLIPEGHRLTTEDLEPAPAVGPPAGEEEGPAASASQWELSQPVGATGPGST